MNAHSRQTSTALHVTTGRLRFVQTTDLHMQLLPYDYVNDRADQRIGLLGLVDEITALKNDPTCTTLLLDNGDALQGNPVADRLATLPDTDEIHPLVDALNLLGYDAMSLGNHDFDYGIAFLERTLSKAQFAVTSANVGGNGCLALMQPYALLDRDIACTDGKTRQLRIGVIGFAPPNVVGCSASGRSDSIETFDIVETAERLVPQMRGDGADIVVALCHSGIKNGSYAPRMENAAVPLSAVAGIDVVLAGHTHERFPDPTGKVESSIDPQRGTLHGKPCVMPAPYGRDLGVVDLTLAFEGERWRIAQHEVRHVRRNSPAAPHPLQHTIKSKIAAHHNATVAHLRKPVAQVSAPMHEFFAGIATTPNTQLLADAMRAFAGRAAGGTKADGLPILAAAAPLVGGAHDNPARFYHNRSGKITHKDLAAIVPFADALCILCCTGVQIRNWLERAAAHYLQLHHDGGSQQMINPQSASHHCDILFGLSYEIDLTRPALYSADGALINGGAARVMNISYKGQAVTDSDRFAVTANSFRANGGGNFSAALRSELVLTSQLPLRKIVRTHLAYAGHISATPRQTWRFAPVAGSAGRFQSSPAARDYLPPHITHEHDTEDGFANYRIAL